MWKDRVLERERSFSSGSEEADVEETSYTVSVGGLTSRFVVSNLDGSVIVNSSYAIGDVTMTRNLNSDNYMGE